MISQTLPETGAMRSEAAVVATHRSTERSDASSFVLGFSSTLVAGAVLISALRMRRWLRW